jgi:ribosome biogenesis GTPase
MKTRKAKRAAAGDMGIVMANYGKQVEVLAGDGRTLTAELASDLGRKPVAGDRVHFVQDEGGAYLTELLPRERVIRRSGHRESEDRVLAAHVDCVVIVSAVQPPFKEGLVDRYIVAALQSEIEPVVVLNKIDLDDGAMQDRCRIYADLGYRTHYVSAITRHNVDSLAHDLQNKTSVLVGHSGVGKSSLLMALLPDVETDTAEISHYSGKGVHTTSAARMWVGSGGLRIIDSPGIRAFGLADIERQEVREYFVEIAVAGAGCRFRDCLHTGDAGCAVKEAVDRGEITQIRYDSYLRILESLR